MSTAIEASDGVLAAHILGRGGGPSHRQEDPLIARVSPPKEARVGSIPGCRLLMGAREP